MDALTAITQRVSSPQLTGPGPDNKQLECLFQAAFRAPDHARLRPWRYLTVSGDNRAQLGEVFAQAALKNTPDLSEERLAKYRKMPMRAPVLIVAIARLVPHEKVPEHEQLLAAGAGVQNMLTAAYAMGLGAIWRTGEMAENPDVRDALGLTSEERLIGFIYLGHVNCRLKEPPQLKTEDFVSEWPGS